MKKVRMNAVNMMSIDSLSIPAEPTQPQKWYRQFWPWLLIGLPATAVVASFITLFIAIDKADDLVIDNYYNEGLAINRELAADDHAQQLEIRATTTIDVAHPALAIALEGAFTSTTRPKQIIVHFVHPVSAARDLLLVLNADSSGVFRSALPHVMDGRWTLEIRDLTSSWRLRRDIAIAPATASTFVLAPLTTAPDTSPHPTQNTTP
jgi:hypothetical protein